MKKINRKNKKNLLVNDLYKLMIKIKTKFKK